MNIESNFYLIISSNNTWNVSCAAGKKEKSYSIYLSISERMVSYGFNSTPAFFR
jgi:hypothetical protein